MPCVRSRRRFRPPGSASEHTVDSPKRYGTSSDDCFQFAVALAATQPREPPDTGPLANSLEQLREGHMKSARQRDQRFQSWVALGALEKAHSSPVQAAGVRELLLTEPSLLRRRRRFDAKRSRETDTRESPGLSRQYVYRQCRQQAPHRRPEQPPEATVRRALASGDLRGSPTHPGSTPAP
jgi:hypothetical protein